MQYVLCSPHRSRAAVPRRCSRVIFISMASLISHIPASKATKHPTIACRIKNKLFAAPISMSRLAAEQSFLLSIPFPFFSSCLVCEWGTIVTAQRQCRPAVVFCMKDSETVGPNVLSLASTCPAPAGPGLATRMNANC